MVYQLQAAFEKRALRIPDDETLREDLRALRREVTEEGNLRFTGQYAGSHCDRFWAKALRQHALATRPGTVVAFVG